MSDTAETQTPARGPGRPRLNREDPVRGNPREDNDPRERAARRAAELTGHLDALDQGTDEFAFDRDIIPDGWDYEWKVYTIGGQTDVSRQQQQEKGGWEPVPTSRHPEMMARGSTDPVIMRKGLMLMERPLIITEKVRAHMRKEAKAQVRGNEERLGQAPEGQFTRDHRDVKPVIKHGYEPIEIPDEA